MVPHHGPILLAADDPDLRGALESALAGRGYDVLSTGDGLEAVELAGASGPAVAVVDLLLPGQSGFRVAEALKARYGERVRVLLMSEFASPHQRHYATAAGADAFLPKPFPLPAVVALVAKLCPVVPVAPARVRVGA